MKIPKKDYLEIDAEFWLKNPELRRTSLTTRGVWMSMLHVMLSSGEYGVLKIRGKVPSPSRLARACGVKLSELLFATEELLKNGVVTRNEEGAIVCKYMPVRTGLMASFPDRNFIASFPNGER